MLVTPERIVHKIPDRAALADLVQRHKLGWKLHGNLRQLLGFDKVGAGRKQRGEAGIPGLTGIENKYYRFEDVTWFYNAEVSTAVPLFGSQREKHGTLKATFGIKFSERDFNRMLSSDLPSRVIEGWQQRRGPQLGDGASLIGLPSSRLLDAVPAVPVVPSPDVSHAMHRPSCATSAANPAAASAISAATTPASTTNGVEPLSTAPPSTAPPSTVTLSAATADPIEAAIAAVRCAITPP